MAIQFRVSLAQRENRAYHRRYHFTHDITFIFYFNFIYIYFNYMQSYKLSTGMAEKGNQTRTRERDFAQLACN